jgi:hypothetical protein
VAARLPKKPGIQKLMPFSSANPIVVVDATIANANDVAAILDGKCD